MAIGETGMKDISGMLCISILLVVLGYMSVVAVR